jgi:hypothetical protein
MTAISFQRQRLAEPANHGANSIPISITKLKKTFQTHLVVSITTTVGIPMVTHKAPGAIQVIRD